jgi:hypothetical protein
VLGTEIGNLNSHAASGDVASMELGRRFDLDNDPSCLGLNSWFRLENVRKPGETVTPR